MRKMNPEWKEKWATALESGEYEQGYNCLRSEEGGFCCLGVLCDIVGRETEGLRWDKRKSGTYEIGADGSSNFLPPEVQAITGLDRNPYVMLPINRDSIDWRLQEYPLSNLNDSGDYDFTQIADLIRKHL